ncbi:MAG: SDR family oxidoreductase [Rhodospirillaceae bacterium]|nr:MAG: SDR family oxidoreductase [Rhodospirillaceae bacterium]
MNLQSYQQGGRVAVITGAAGGMGRACSRRMGHTYRLVLADVSAKACEAEAKILREDGYDIAAALTCDISDPAAVDRLAQEAAAAGPLGALVHTAGLSPSLADWEPILRVNYVGTSLLLDAFLRQAVRGSVAVCIASSAGYMLPLNPEIEAIFDSSRAPDVMKRLEVAVMKVSKAFGNTPAQISYPVSKRGVHRLVRDRVQEWADKGGRITSISPGLIRTPMSIKESESAAFQGLLEQVPIPRWGTPMDIANAVHFLCSDEASYITGCDLPVCGGSIAIATKQLAERMAGRAPQG